MPLLEDTLFLLEDIVRTLDKHVFLLENTVLLLEDVSGPSRNAVFLLTDVIFQIEDAVNLCSIQRHVTALISDSGWRVSIHRSK